MKQSAWKLLGLVLIVILSFSAPTPVHAASLTKTIATYVTPIGVFYDPKMNEIFVSNYDSDAIQVISDSSNAQVAVISNMPGAPYYMVYDSSKSEIWVAGATEAYAISDATNQIVANVTTRAPEKWGTLTQVAYDPKTGEVFVSYSDFTGFSTPYIQVISDSSNTVTANITQSVTGIVDDSAKSEIFASQYLDSSGLSSGVTYVISAKTNAVIASIPNTASAGSLVYDSGKGEIFASYGGAVIKVISDSSNKVVATINLPSSGGVLPGLGAMAYNPNKGEIYVSLVNSNGQVATSSVAILSDETNSVIGTVNTNGSTDGDIAYDSGTNTVYAINNPGSVTGSMGSLVVISNPSSGTFATSGTTSKASSTTSAKSVVTATTTTVLHSTSSPTSSTHSLGSPSTTSSSSSSSSSYLASVVVVVVVVLVILGLAVVRRRRRVQSM